MDLDEFLEALAKARYLEEIYAGILAKGIIDAFSEK